MCGSVVRSCAPVVTVITGHSPVGGEMCTSDGDNLRDGHACPSDARPCAPRSGTSRWTRETSGDPRTTCHGGHSGDLSGGTLGR